MPRQIGGFRARAEYLPVPALGRTFSALRLERAASLGASIGSILMQLDIGNRPIALKNLEIAFPELDRAARLQILLGMYRNWGRMMAEWTRYQPYSLAFARIFSSWLHQPCHDLTIFASRTRRREVVHWGTLIPTTKRERDERIRLREES